MALRPLATQKAPAALGPYSQGVQDDNMIYTSGQLAIDPITGEICNGDIQKETRMCLDNIIAVLEAGHATLENVVKVTVFITDMSNFPLINEVYAEYFKNNKPARSLVEVSKLPKGGDIEIEAIAII